MEKRLSRLNMVSHARYLPNIMSFLATSKGYVKYDIHASKLGSKEKIEKQLEYFC